MSRLTDSNGEAAKEWIGRAHAYYSSAETTRGSEISVTVRHLVSAAEMAVKAVYIHHETYYPRTHDTAELINKCPDPTAAQAAAGYTTEFMRWFASQYLAPYERMNPLTPGEVDSCFAFAAQVIAWAEHIVG